MMAMKAAQFIKKKNTTKDKKGKSNSLIDWIGNRRNSKKKMGKWSKEDKKHEQDEE
jgi:hypothetical protein